MRRTTILALVFVVGLFAACTVLADPQSKASGTLTGVVIGPDDRPVAHAVVSYQSSGGNAPHAVHADAKGRFTISKLRSDAYEVRASGRGVFSEWEKNVFVRSGKTKDVTLRLIYAKEIPKAYTATRTYEGNSNH
jgi:Carboxypeptidase regulatory-like domain